MSREDPFADGGRAWLPAVGVFLYWATVLGLGGFRADHLAVGVLVLALAYGLGARGRWIGALLLPIVLTGVAYDAQRYLHRVVRGTVRVAEPYLWEKSLFGIPGPQGVQTLNEWFRARPVPSLDVVTGVVYLGFIPIFILTVFYFAQVGAKHGTTSRSAAYVEHRVLRMPWSLFWVSCAAFLTHALIPTAPPWYVAEFGLGPALLDTPPDPAGAARFDTALGGSYFSSFYGKSVNTFGAVPSLHVAWPALAVYWSFRFGALRIASVVFLVLLCVAAVYLDHHYIVDVVAGVAYALAAALMVDGVGEAGLRARRAEGEETA
jgi:hypothetical protein